MTTEPWAVHVRPGMSPETQRALADLYRRFPGRVASANRKLADKPAALLKPEKTGEAQSPHFRITLNPDHPDTPNRLAKLYKLGVQGSAVSFQEASR